MQKEKEKYDFFKETIKPVRFKLTLIERLKLGIINNISFSLIVLSCISVWGIHTYINMTNESLLGIYKYITMTNKGNKFDNLASLIKNNKMETLEGENLAKLSSYIKSNINNSSHLISYTKEKDTLSIQIKADKSTCNIIALKMYEREKSAKLDSLVINDTKIKGSQMINEGDSDLLCNLELNNVSLNFK